MADSNIKTPWHLWLVGILGALWNSIGVFDYIMTQTRNESYMSNFTTIQLEYFYGLPAWAVASWAIAVWTALLGSILLLLRKKLAVPVFVIGLIAYLLTCVHNYGLSNGMEIMGGVGALIFSAVIFVITLFLLLYSKAMTSKGILS